MEEHAVRAPDMDSSALVPQGLQELSVNRKLLPTPALMSIVMETEPVLELIMAVIPSVTVTMDTKDNNVV